MKKLLLALLALSGALQAAVPPPTEASTAQVTAGTSGTTYISPRRAKSAGGFGGGPTGVTAGSTFGTDNRAVRSDGTGRGTQSSGVTIDDAGGISTAGDIASTAGSINGIGSILSSASTTVFQEFRRPAGSAAGLLFKTLTSSRWGLFISSTAESGSNAGSNLVFARYSDAGSGIDDVLTLNRATGFATFIGSIIAPAATTSIPSFRAPHGTAPSSPTDGDIWTTTAGLYARINGGTVGPYGTGLAVPTQITVADTTDTTSFVALFESATGDLGPKTDGGILYNAGTGMLTVTGLTATTATFTTFNVTDLTVSGTFSPGSYVATVANGGTGRATSTTAYGLLAAGTTATGAHQTLAQGATTEILVGGGAALPVWTAATGTGSPVRGTAPQLSSIELGHATDTTITRVSAGVIAVEGVTIGAPTLTSTRIGYGDGSNLLTGEAAFIYTAATNIATIGGISLGAGSEVSTIGPLVDAVDGTTPLNNINQVVAAGTAYTLTASYASLDFGTTDPVLTIANAGTYAIYVNIQFNLVGATYATYDSVTAKLRRTNNTAADLTGSIFGTFIPTITTITAVGPQLSIGPIKYTTSATDDLITVQATLNSTPSVGSVTASAVTITAIRAY